jgi:hypothetical protein
MTRRRSAVFLALSVALGFLLAASPAVAGGPACSKAFAERVAGSYLEDLTVEGVPFPLKAMNTLGADGTFSSEDVFAFGLHSGGFNSDHRGTWRRSGRREVTFNSVAFLFDSNGMLTGLARLHGTMRFERGFAAFSAEGVNEIFGVGDDPLDPEAVPFLSFPFTATGRLIPPTVE